MKLRVYEIHLFKYKIETTSSSHHDDDRANREKFSVGKHRVFMGALAMSSPEDPVFLCSP